MRKFLIIVLSLVFAGLLTSTIVLAVKCSTVPKTPDIEVSDTSGLINTVEELQKLVKELNSNKSELENQVNALTVKNESLQAQLDSLQAQLTVDAEIINALEQELAENEILINNLNTQINSLNSSITYYEDYIQRFENENQVTATFIEEDVVIATPICLKNSKVSAPDVSDTHNGYRSFVGWTVNNELIDLTTYIIEDDTTFVAKFNYYNIVYFTDEFTDIATYDFLLVGESLESIIPDTPVVNGMVFDGWFILTDIMNETYGDQVSAEYIPSANGYQEYIIRAKWSYNPINGTYNFVLWHPTLTIQSTVTLFGSDITHTFSDNSISATTKGIKYFVNSDLKFYSDTNVLELILYFSNTKPAVGTGVRINVLFEFDSTNDVFVVKVQNVYYYTGSSSVVSENITSGTTITFREAK